MFKIENMKSKCVFPRNKVFSLFSSRITEENEHRDLVSTICSKKKSLTSATALLLFII